MCILQKLPGQSSQCHLLHPLGIASAFFFSWHRNFFKHEIKSENSTYQYVLLPPKEKQFKKFRLIANMQTQLWILGPKTSYPIPEEGLSKSENIPWLGPQEETDHVISGFQRVTNLNSGHPRLTFHRKLLWPIKYKQGISLYSLCQTYACNFFFLSNSWVFTVPELIPKAL